MARRARPILAAIPALMLFNRRRDQRSAAEHVREVDGEIRVDASMINKGDARFYVCEGPSAKGARLLVVRRADRTVAVALDASETSSVGFRKEHGRLARNGCGLRFAVDDVARLTGECYPVPLRYVVHDGNVAARAQDVEATMLRLQSR